MADEPNAQDQQVQDPPQQQQQAPWYQGGDAELVGHIQNRGLDKMTPAEAAFALAKAHREAEKFVGLPTDRLLTLPKDANDADGWAKVHRALGVPADAKDYNFGELKFADGTPASQSFQDFVRNDVAAKFGLTPAAATGVAEGIIKWMDQAASADATENQAKVEEGRAALKTNWGANYDANLFVAKAAAAKLGVQPAEIEALEKVVGYEKVMEMFRSIGQKTGESRFVENDNPAAPGVFTREQAVAKRAELMQDPKFVARYNEGGTNSDEYKEMYALNQIIAGSGDPNAGRLFG